MSIGKSVLGAVAGFVLCDLFKLIQFGFDFRQYMYWWVREFYYCFRLDQPEDFGDITFIERYKAVADLLMDQREGYLFLAIMLLLPVIMLLIYFWSMRQAGKGNPHTLSTTLLVMGFFLFLVFSAFDDRVILAVPQIWNYQYRGERDTVNEITEVIKTLPENSEYYGVGWRFAPAVSLLADIEIKDMSENVSFEDIDTRHFYIVEEFPVEEIYEKYRYNIIYKSNENTWQGSIVELITEK